MIEGWTDDFSKFKQKIEPLFGRLELLAEEYPDVYCHQVFVAWLYGIRRSKKLV